MKVEWDEAELRGALAEAYRLWPVRHMQPQEYEFVDLVMQVLEERRVRGDG